MTVLCVISSIPLTNGLLERAGTTEQLEPVSAGCRNFVLQPWPSREGADARVAMARLEPVVPKTGGLGSSCPHHETTTSAETLAFEVRTWPR